ncbi:MAG: hypothetical protein LBC68_04145 [Prevotellaceae bacterium]|jgi:hypothetical protein|nr:hypothetical protein [Prevotellaceae bacterium]
MKTQKSIFEVIEIGYYSHKKPRYPSFEVRQHKQGIFSTLAKAEQAMNEYIEEEKQYDRLQEIFGFFINECTLDRLTSWMAKSRRSYLPDGSLWDRTLVSEEEGIDGDLEEFMGRPENMIRFNIGDLVEVLSFNTVTLEIVGNLPSSPDEVQYLKERACKRSSDHLPLHLDSSDDGYYTLDQYGEHSHPEAVKVFPVRFKVSKILKNKLLSKEYYGHINYNQKSIMII